ncbi:MAG: methyltransferase [Planctomycetota bacterium]|jgi:hypothetical protein
MNVDEAAEKMEAVSKISGAFQEAAALLAANQLGIFASLADGTRKAEVVAAEIPAPLRGVKLLMDALAGMGLLVKEGEYYRNAPDADEVLVPGKPFYMGDMLRHSAALFERFARLPDAVRSGEPLPRKGGKRSPQQQRDFILAMANIGALSARKLLPHLGLSGTERILDLGGGPGTYLQVFCEANLGLRGTLFDLPETTRIAHEYLAGKPGADRIEIRDGDYFTDPFGDGYDAVLLSNIIHSLGPDSIRMIFRKSRASLVPGGRIFVKDFLLQPDRTMPRYAAVFALNMFLGTKEGACYTFDEVETWLRDAGFSVAGRIQLTPQSALAVGIIPPP